MAGASGVSALPTIKRGRDEHAKARQKHECKGCGKRFDDLTGTVPASDRPPLKRWIVFLYFMGLNLSTRQIAQELNLKGDEAQHMAEVLRTGIVEKKPEAKLWGEVEGDDVCVAAGH